MCMETMDQGSSCLVGTRKRDVADSTQYMEGVTKKGGEKRGDPVDATDHVDSLSFYHLYISMVRHRSGCKS
jgi:hypothetical protein